MHITHTHTQIKQTTHPGFSHPEVIVWLCSWLSSFCHTPYFFFYKNATVHTLSKKKKAQRKWAFFFISLSLSVWLCTPKYILETFYRGAFTKQKHLVFFGGSSPSRWACCQFFKYSLSDSLRCLSGLSSSIFYFNSRNQLFFVLPTQLIHKNSTQISFYLFRSSSFLFPPLTPVKIFFFLLRAIKEAIFIFSRIYKNSFWKKKTWRRIRQPHEGRSNFLRTTTMLFLYFFANTKKSKTVFLFFFSRPKKTKRQIESLKLFFFTAY